MANPATYRGVEYRSEFQARWAAFLHLRGYGPSEVEGGWLIVDGQAREWVVLPRPFTSEIKCVRYLGQIEEEFADAGTGATSGIIVVGVDPTINAAVRVPFGGLVHPPWGDIRSMILSSWREAGVAVKYGA